MVMSLVPKKCAFWVNNYQSRWIIHRPFYIKVGAVMEHMFT